MLNLNKDKVQRDGTIKIKTQVQSMEDIKDLKFKKMKVFQLMQLKKSLLSILDKQLLQEVPEVFKESAKSLRLLMTTITSHLIKKSSKKLCMISELVLMKNKLD